MLDSSVTGRYVIYGAGAIGATIGARLHEAGFGVALVARGAHLDALRRDGLRFESPELRGVLRIPAAGSAGELAVEAHDVVILCMKGQDTEPAVEELFASAPRDVTVVCAQNGVENERIALRRFANVYGALVVVAAQHIDAGSVQAFFAPRAGVLDIGRVPEGEDERARAIAADLRAAGFDSRAVPDIMRWKRTKLLRNVRNAVEVIAGDGEEADRLFARGVEEAEACLRAAGLAFASMEELSERFAPVATLRPVDGRLPRSSSSQSLARGTGSIEADYLNGEIVLLGRLHGHPTPVNEALQRLALEMARRRLEPGSLGTDAVEDLIRALSPR
jgi:2-dehydropantoate 2-reductase